MSNPADPTCKHFCPNCGGHKQPQAKKKKSDYTVSLGDLPKWIVDEAIFAPAQPITATEIERRRQLQVEDLQRLHERMRAAEAQAQPYWYLGALQPGTITYRTPINTEITFANIANGEEEE
jgi:hypothetical protein